MSPKQTPIESSARKGVLEQSRRHAFLSSVMLVAGQTMLVLECTPAAYINLAANEAEKAAAVNLMHVTSVGVYGRLWMAGTEADILAARNAAVAALEGIDGRD